MTENLNQTTARLASLGELKKSTLPVLICPIPCNNTLRAMLDRAGIPRYKANPLCRRGGGTVYYSVSAVEKLFRNRTLPKFTGGSAQ